MFSTDTKATFNARLRKALTLLFLASVFLFHTNASCKKPKVDDSNSALPETLSNDPLKKVFIQYHSNSTALAEKSVITYDTDGKRLKKESIGYAHNGTTITVQSVSSYENDKIHTIETQYYNADGSAITSKVVSTYTYQNNKIHSVTGIYYDADGLPTTKQVYTYDTDNAATKTTEKNYTYRNGTWEEKI